MEEAAGDQWKNPEYNIFIIILITNETKNFRMPKRYIGTFSLHNRSLWR